MYGIGGGGVVVLEKYLGIIFAFIAGDANITSKLRTVIGQYFIDSQFHIYNDAYAAINR